MFEKEFSQIIVSVFVTPPNSSTSISFIHPLRIRSLQETYAEITEINNSILFYLFANLELLNFKEDIKEEKWRTVMNVEIRQQIRMMHDS
jgi:hypothetical protein